MKMEQRFGMTAKAIDGVADDKAVVFKNPASPMARPAGQPNIAVMGACHDMLAAFLL
jgi:hypothetical protein